MRGFLKKLNFFVQPEQSNNVQISIKTEDMEPMKEYNQDHNKEIVKEEQPSKNMPQGENKLMPPVNEYPIKQQNNVSSIENKKELLLSSIKEKMKEYVTLVRSDRTRSRYSY